MARITYDILAEPAGATYRALLGFGYQFGASCSLVVRAPDELEPTAVKFLAACEPDLIDVSDRSAWPGTELLGHTARLYRYNLSADMVDRLCGHSDRLWGWRMPSLPEDLALYRWDGTVLLGSIAHEQEAWLEIMTEAEAWSAKSLALPLRVHDRTRL